MKGLNLFYSNPLKKFFIIVLLLATASEFIQLWVPARSFNLFDWVANVGGIVVGIGIIMMVPRHRGKEA
jgi:VanZ family protein